MASKQQVKARYIARLQAKYPFYVEGSRPLKLANDAADAALAGRMKLEGEAWSEALADCGLPARIAMKALAALPEGEGGAAAAQTVSAAYVEAITDERQMLRGMEARGEYNGAEDAKAFLSNCEATLRRGFSGEVRENLRGARDFWRGQLAKETEVERVMRDTGMDRMQAVNHVRGRNWLRAQHPHLLRLFDQVTRERFPTK